MTFLRCNEGYINGVDDFLNNVFTRAAQKEEICCLCKKCCFHYWHHRNIVYSHLIINGFTLDYNK